MTTIARARQQGTDANDRLVRVARRSTGPIGDPEARERFARIVSHLTRLGDEMVTFSDLLGALWELCQHPFVRGPETWRGAAVPVEIRFRWLIHHVWAKYEVPLFMDSALFGGLRLAGFVPLWAWMARGGSLREAVRRGLLPKTLTRRMLHLFAQAPPTSDVIRAIRRAQWLALGGQPRHAHLLLECKLGREIRACDHEDLIFVQWLVRHQGKLWSSRVGPFLDYVEHARQQPHFDLFGRTLGAINRARLVWEAETRVLWAYPQLPREVAGCGLPGGQFRLGGREWSVRELTTFEALVMEGQQMHHCVASYWPYVTDGRVSIWAVRGASPDKRVLRATLEVRNREQLVVQGRGHCNKRLEPDTRAAVGKWTREVGLGCQFG